MTNSDYKPTDKEQLFLKYYEKLIWETLYARAHLKLGERLENFKDDYHDELIQAPHFFTFTIRAHFDDSLMILSRILRRQRKALTISRFLDFVEQNSEIFSKEAFSQRMIGKSNYKYEINSHTPITTKEIKEDRQKLTDLQDTVRNLVTWRDKILAHIDEEFLVSDKKISRRIPFAKSTITRNCRLAFQNSKQIFGFL